MTLRGIVFLDIETVKVSKYEDADLELLRMFTRKYQSEVNKPDTAIKEIWNEKAGLHAEFGKVICICIGMMASDKKFYIKKLYGEDEKELLSKLYSALSTHPGTLVAHNGKEFDFPFLMRKFMMYNLPIPNELNVYGKKPWDIALEDTMVMWSGSAWNYKVSLELLCYSLGVPSPKGAMSGKSVADVYFEAEDKIQALEHIAEYCAGDVVAMVNCYCRMRGIEVPDKNSIIVYA